VSKSLEVAEKEQKVPEMPSRRFCVAPMMDGEGWRQKALWF
jgi:hypothetical protein